MTPKDLRQILTRCFDGDDEAIRWFTEFDLEVMARLLDVVEAVELDIEAKKLTYRNSYAAEALEELELEQWTLPTRTI